MGNKNFVLRNSEKIKYDSRWYVDDQINTSYLIHQKARIFNKEIYSISASQEALFLEQLINKSVEKTT